MIKYLAILAVILACADGNRVSANEPIDVGTRRELFVDDHLVDQFRNEARLRLHKPVAREVVLVTDRPWEGNTCAYYTIFQDDDIYRMYYRGSHYDEEKKKAAHREVTCYAESRDGVQWTRPNLGLFVYDGSKNNNIVWDGIGTHCFAVFKDANPDCRPDARYKAISRGRPQGKKGLYVFKSSDAIHWSLMADEPVITDGAFDSQNLAFWDPYIRKYREYHRTFHAGVRAIMTGTSTDFVNWSEPVLLEYTNAANEHLYTNAIRPYERAPHILIGFPTRFLPDQASRVEPVFMASRDGRVFYRWPQAVVPEDAPEDRGGNRSNYMTWGLVQRPGDPRHYSVYATEAYYVGPDSRVRRFEYRVDGFVSVHGSLRGGEMVTKPLKFGGGKLGINFATASPQGSLQVEIQKVDGRPFAGFGASDCRVLRGNEIARTVAWKRGQNLSGLAGKTVRLRFVLKDADLYSFRFSEF